MDFLNQPVINSSSLFCRKRFRISYQMEFRIEISGGETIRKDNGGRDDRASQRTSSRFIGTGDMLVPKFPGLILKAQGVQND